ncbi:uncharacterized protein LOC127277435 [Leptopilina boulardi]|uniref:uncharacterized protein LOC127277435 n=1 Tax=Leptopilina boulardi TaxID=63433 RepID=UPI0021F690D4|nr:uncharacterized protein LOC127277435 [Leptopilina boulardi]
MDNTSSIFIQQSPNFQFLSVCHYITIFGLYFYNEDLITLDERNQSVPVLNTLFEYLNKSTNESETKLQLLRKVLKGSDLYGGGENETLDMKYVDETYQYIISEALFSHYGNINGYLAKIINTADDINYLAIKEKVFQHLSENYTSREYCSNNIPLGNYGSNYIPSENYGSNDIPLGNNTSINIPSGNYSSFIIPSGNYSSINISSENYNSINISLGNYSFLNIPSGNNSSINIPSENYSYNNIPSGNYSFKLNRLTIEKVFDNHIWAIFPEPEQDMSIMEVNYIYAMVGLKIVRSISSTSPNLTFQEYILISREIDLQDFSNATYEMVLKLFSTPALLFYAHNQKSQFQEIVSIPPDEFWTRVYENLFSYINSKMTQIVHEDLENSLYKKLEVEITNLKSRTFLAIKILGDYCNYESYANVSPVYVAIYKTFYLWITKLLLPNNCLIDDLPDLEKIYNDQFLMVEEIYNKIEMNAIEKVLIDGNLLKEMTINSTVMLAEVPHYPQRCTYCSPKPRKKNKEIYLLIAIKNENKSNFYALRQENNTLSLLTNRGNESKFAKAVANDSSLRMVIAIFSKTLKYSDEDYRGFIRRVGEIKTKQFVDGLKIYNYEETEGEKLLNFLKSLIPFYSCIESFKNNEGSTFSCSVDILSLIPLGGFAVKYTTKLSGSLSLEIGKKYLITNSLARAGLVTKLPIATLLNQISRIAIQTLAREILSRRLLKDLTIASLRVIDPGFELFYQVSTVGFRVFFKLFQKMITNLKNISPIKNTVFKLLVKNLERNINLISDSMGLVPSVLAKGNYEIVRYNYPGGSNFFGSTCLKSFGNTAELRTIEGYSFPLPVVREKSGFYHQYNSETGETIKGKLKMNSDDVLQRVGNLINEMVINGRDINIIRNYHVYHNRIKWNKPKEEGEDLNNQKLDDDNLYRERLFAMSLKDLLNAGEKPPPVKLPLNSNQLLMGDFQISKNKKLLPGDDENSNIPQKIRKLDESMETYRHKKFDIKNRETFIKQDHSIKLDHEFYKMMIKEPTYTRYVDILTIWKNEGLSAIKTDGVKINFLRTAVNEIALLQLNSNLQLKKPQELWYTQILKGQKIINYLRSLQGRKFFFNDITMLTTTSPTIMKKLNPFLLETEIRYHLKIDSIVGFVDLTNFHSEFKNIYLTFDDIFFTITDTFFTADNKILNIELRTNVVTRDFYFYLRKREILLQKVETVESSRMKLITNAANFIMENAPLHNFKTTRDFLSNYILNTNPNSNQVPSYDMFAMDYSIMEYHHSYNDWKIENNPYIQDVLFNYNLDEIIDLPEARRRIHELYNNIHFQNIEQAFENYVKIRNVEHLLRFEDFYVLHSYLKNRLIQNSDGLRRLEVAINRLGIRQCEEESMLKPIIKIYRSEIITNDMSVKFFESFQKKDIIAFDKIKKFVQTRDEEIVKLLNTATKTSGVPFLLEITIVNHAGVVEIGRTLNEEHYFHMVTSNFEFVFDELKFIEINQQKILFMRMHDNKTPKEKRIIQMAKKLHELLTSDTKFYSDVKN